MTIINDTQMYKALKDNQDNINVKLNIIENNINKLMNNDQPLNHYQDIITLHKRIEELENNNIKTIHELKNRIIELENINDKLLKKFQIFEQDNNIQYLEKFNINTFNNCEYDEKVKYLQRVDLTQNNNESDKYKPIHEICFKSSPESIELIFDMHKKLNLDIECETHIKSKPIHFICQNSNLKMIKFILDLYVEKNLDIECVNDYYKTPIDYILTRNIKNNPQTTCSKIEFMNNLIDICIEQNMLQIYHDKILKYTCEQFDLLSVRIILAKYDRKRIFDLRKLNIIFNKMYPLIK